MPRPPTVRHRSVETNGNLTDRASTRILRPSNTDEWRAWYEKRDNARLGVHHVILTQFDCKPSYWNDPEFVPDTETRRRMTRAEKRLRYVLIYYGLDLETEAEFEDMWCAPKELRRHPVKVPPPPPPPVTLARESNGRIKARLTSPEDGSTDLNLVRLVMAGDASAKRMNSVEYECAAWLMYYHPKKPKTVTDIARRLQRTEDQVMDLITAYAIAHPEEAEQAS